MSPPNATSQPGSLREAIQDSALQDRANQLWQTAKKVHHRQTAPGESSSGHDHCLEVERIIFRILKGSHSLNRFVPPETFLLSAAACCHDFGKAVGEESRTSPDHGADSGRYIIDHYEELHLYLGEANALQRIVSVHALSSDIFRDECDELRDPTDTEHGAIDVRRLAVLLKLADVLHTYGRASGLTVDTDALRRAAEGAEAAAARPPTDANIARARERRVAYEKAVFRGRATGWEFEGLGTIRVTVCPLFPDEVDPIHKCGSYLVQEEFAPLKDALVELKLPDRLRINVDPSLLRSRRPSGPEPPAPEAPSPAWAEANSLEDALVQPEPSEPLRINWAAPHLPSPGPRAPEPCTPAWAEPHSARELIPPLLAGSWDDSCNADRDALSRIARADYADVIPAVVKWSNAEDAPLRRVAHTWEWVSRRRAWMQLGRFLTRDDLDAWQEVALEIFAALDPRYDLPPGERWLAQVMGQVPPNSARLRAGLAETLPLLAVHGDAAGIQEPVRGQDRANSAVWSVLEDGQDWRKWASLSDVLPTLAEAAPEAFLDAVEDVVQEDASVFAELFGAEALMGGSPHTGLLWALEALAWKPGYLTQVTVLLGQLAAVDPGGRLRNRPQESLRDIFLPWLPHTVASPQERTDAIDVLAKRQPDVAWKLVLSLLPVVSDSSFGTREPEWQNWADDWTKGVTRQEFSQCVRALGDRLVGMAGADATRWCALLEKLGALPPASWEAAIRRLGEVAGHMAVEDQAAVWEALRGVLHSHRRHADAVWALPAEAVDKLERVYEQLRPGDLLQQSGWLFSGRPEFPDGGDRDWHAEQEMLERARAAAINKIAEEGGADRLVIFAESVELPHQLGVCAGRVGLARDVQDELVARGLGAEDHARRQLALGFVAARFEADGWVWVEGSAESTAVKCWSASQRADFACGLPFEGRTWDLAASWGPEVEELYWRRVMAYVIRTPEEDGNRAIESLLAADRPNAALQLASSCVDHEERRTSLSPEVLVRVLEAAASADPVSEDPPVLIHSPEYHIGLILDALENSDDIDPARMAQLEWLYVRLLADGERQPKFLHAELSRDPEFFAKVVRLVYKRDDGEAEATDGPAATAAARARAGYELLRSWSEIPGSTEDGAIDAAGLAAWIERARVACTRISRLAMAEEEIGRMLAHSPVGSDQQWPHEAVRERIEEASSRNLEDGFCVEVMNSRGMHTKALDEGGVEERDLAKRYRGHAEALAAQYPRTAAVLRSIAESYESQARREDERAKQWDDL